MAGSITVREILTKFGFKVDKVALDNLKSRLEDIQATLTQIRDANLAVAIAAAAATAAFVAQGFATAKLSTEIIDNAEALGLTTDRYQELNFIMEKFGLDSEAVTEVLAEVSIKANDAATGLQSAADSFAIVGINVRELKDLSADEAFLEIAEAISKTEDASKRTVAAFEIFGDDLGRKLLPLLGRGREGFERLAKAARESGAVFDADKLRLARRFGLVITDITTRFGLVRFTAGAAIAESLEVLTRKFSKFFDKNKDGILKFVESFSKGVGDALVGIADSVKSLAKTFGIELGDFDAENAGFMLVIIAMVAALDALALSVAIITLGLGLFIATIGLANLSVLAVISTFVFLGVAAALIFDDLAAFFRGGESAFGEMIDGFINKLRAFASFFKGYGKFLSNTVSGAFSSFFGDGESEEEAEGRTGRSSTTDRLATSSRASNIVTSNMSTSSSTTNSVGGDTITINGSGMSAGQTESMISRRQNEKFRQARSVFAGGER